MPSTFEIRTSGDSIEDIITALLARARRLFPGARISGELASLNKAVAYRIEHGGVLAFGEPWIAIVELVTRWTADSGSRTAMSLDDMKRIVERYDFIVEQAESLGLFKPHWKEALSNEDQ